MISIEELTKYRTSDGMEFENEDAAMVHEIELATKEINPNDITVKNRFGETVSLVDLWWNISSAYYVEVNSEAALDFFNEASKAEGLVPLEQGMGRYRYSEKNDFWITPQEEAQQLWERWSIYNEDIKFTVS